MYQSDLKVVPELSQGCPKVVTISFRVVLKCCNAGSRGLIPFYIVCQPCKKFNSQRVIKSTRGLNASSTASGRSIYPRPNQRRQGRATGVGVGVPTQLRTNVRCCAATWLVLASVWSVAPGARGPHRCVAVQEAPPSGEQHGKMADSDAEFPQNKQKYGLKAGFPGIK